MKAFVKTINEKGGIDKNETEETMLANWLAVITQKDIEDKSIIKNICDEQEAIGMAVSALVKLSEDKITRQAYQRRQDDIILHNMRLSRLELEVKKRDVAHADKDAALADKDVALADKDVALADKDAIIAELRAQLSEK